jgi:RNA polymerase sigma-70 factor (ECF subfamily)
LISAQALREALARLSPKYREVVILHEMEGLTYEECARVLRVPVGTVKSRLYYAFKTLRDLLKEDL